MKHLDLTKASMNQNLNKNLSDISGLNKVELSNNKNEQPFVTDDLTNNFQSVMEIKDKRHASDVIKSSIPGLIILTDNEKGTKRYVGTEKSTPDILKTDYKYLEDGELKSENCPDLLQSVHSNFSLINESDITSEYSIQHLNENISGENNNCNKNITSISFINGYDQYADKEDFWIRMTPADIIGDFEQEVEREFGLFVSGYNCLVGRNIIPNNKKHQQSFVSKEIRDAALSDGIERITQDILGEILKRNIQNSDETMTVKHKIDYLEENTQKINAQPQIIITKKDNEVQLTNKSRIIENIKSSSFDENDKTKFIQIREGFPMKCPLSGKTLQGDNHMPYIKYKKKSYDERQLPPVGIDYKCSVVKTRASRRSQYSEKQINGLQGNSSRISFISACNKQEQEEEIDQYQQLISCNKEYIISRSKYSKMSIWAQYLKNSVRNTNVDELINSQRSKLSLKICDPETNGSMKNFNAMKNHVKSTEAGVPNVYTRFDHDEIRRRLARGVENDYFIASNNDQIDCVPVDNGLCDRIVLDYQNVDQRALFNCDSNKNLSGTTIQNHEKNVQSDDEIDFFTKQARLQIEARTALTQAKDIARFEMRINRRKRCSSPITNLVRDSLERIGIQMPYEKRRVSRQILTDINIPKLQIVVNDLHSYIENLNNLLVNYLLVRDELQIGQDSMIIDIEELTRYLGAKEQSLEKYRTEH